MGPKEKVKHMIIKRNIQYTLKTRSYKGKKVNENLQIRMRVSYNSDRLDLLTGYNIDEEKWDTESQRVKKNCYNKKKESYSDINSALNKAAHEMDQAFKEFEILDRIPSKSELEEAFLKRMKGQTADKKLRKHSRFWEAMTQFKIVEAKKNSWQYTTVQKFNTLENHIKAYKQNPRFEDFNNKGITEFLSILMNTEGLSNSTVKKQLEYLKWFLQWAAVNKYHDVMDFKDYKPHLPTTKNKVIFLSIDEIKKLLAFQIPANRPGLERVRDVFVFCCFTGLRHSDAYNLRRSDIRNDSIEITTKKTADSLVIELNKISRGILEKYKDDIFPDDRALPVISNQKMNDALEDLCELAGFDEDIRITTYQGSKRIDTVIKKYQLITTHAGRRSFICNSLAAGIPVNVVMKWTGHSDYKAMKPYIDVADKIKAREMDKLNNLIDL